MSADVGSSAEAFAYDMRRRAGRLKRRVFARFYAWALSRSLAGHGDATQLQQLSRRPAMAPEHTQAVVAIGIRAPTGSACAESEAGAILPSTNRDSGAKNQANTEV